MKREYIFLSSIFVGIPTALMYNYWKNGQPKFYYQVNETLHSGTLSFESPRRLGINRLYIPNRTLEKYAGSWYMVHARTETIWQGSTDFDKLKYASVRIIYRMEGDDTCSTATIKPNFTK